MVDEADAHGVEYAWIGMDAEFRNPSLFRDLVQRGKEFLIDVRANTFVFPNHPNLRFSQKSKHKSLVLESKKMRVDGFLQGRNRKRWKKIDIRESTKGVLSAEFRHQKVWLDGDDGTAIPLHLLIKRTKKQTGEGWSYKFSLSNAPLKNG